MKIMLELVQIPADGTKPLQKRGTTRSNLYPKTTYVSIKKDDTQTFCYFLPILSENI